MTERTYYESKPSKKVFVDWMFTKVSRPLEAFILFLFILVSLFYANSSSNSENYTLGNFFSASITTIIIIGTIITLFIVFIYFYFLSKTYHYKITDKGIYFDGGILIKKQKFVPFFKVTNVEISQNIIEQMLGISNIKIQTAGPTAGLGGFLPEIILEGLEEVEKPKQLIYKLIKKAKQSKKYDE